MSSKGKSKGWRLIFGLVIVPLALAVIYYAFFAADRFVSTAQVVVREEGSNAASAMPGLSTLLTGANPASREETLYLRQFIISNDMMQVLEDRLQWVEHYRQQRSDVFFLLRNGASREDLLKFYERMVVATYDETTGLLTVEVQALEPEMSKRMLTTILDVSESFVNEMSHGIAREKMKFAKKGEKGTVIYNKRITVKDIPLEAYEYVVNGKPALEWVMERQGVSTHKDSGIVNDANDWAIETMNNPAYPLELFLRVITVSLETMKIVRSLPKLDI